MTTEGAGTADDGPRQPDDRTTRDQAVRDEELPGEPDSGVPEGAPEWPDGGEWTSGD